MCAQLKDRPVTDMVDLPVFGRETHLVLTQDRWRCEEVSCPQGS